ncbi:hypothetical protein KC930_03700 [Candidatus Saccharibacteria bacterium]|nr:hypothetical protein [Candidatus Saccharibacteria bacterium]
MCEREINWEILQAEPSEEVRLLDDIVELPSTDAASTSETTDEPTTDLVPIEDQVPRSWDLHKSGW